MRTDKTPLRVGVGGPVGSGKTALLEQLCKRLRGRYDVAVVTNDIYTREDAEYLIRSQALAPERIVGVETGGCPHTAIREDASMNLAAVEDLQARFPDLDLIFIESGGDNLAAVAPRAGTQIDHKVGRFDCLTIMLNHQHRVADISKLGQGSQQFAIVALVKPDRRLVEDI